MASVEEDRWAKSVTDQGDLEAFLATAELAGTEFTAEKINVHVAQDIRNEAFISDERRRSAAPACMHVSAGPRLTGGAGAGKWTRRWRSTRT